MATRAYYTWVFIRVARGEVIFTVSHMNIPITLHVGGPLGPNAPPLCSRGAKGAFPVHVAGKGVHPSGGVLLLMVSAVKGVGKFTISG